MSRFLPKAARFEYPPCVDLKVLFESDRAAKLVKYLAPFYADHSDSSNERIFRENVITKVFDIAMPTRSAHVAEIELMNALGNENSENIKIYLQKYLDTHTYVYGENYKRVKSGSLLPWTGRDVDLYLLTGSVSRILNAIQLWLVTRIETELGINAQYSISKL